LSRIVTHNWRSTDFTASHVTSMNTCALSTFRPARTSHDVRRPHVHDEPVPCQDERPSTWRHSSAFGALRCMNGCAAVPSAMPTAIPPDPAGLALASPGHRSRHRLRTPVAGDRGARMGEQPSAGMAIHSI
jgi:hypothetical protein